MGYYQIIAHPKYTLLGSISVMVGSGVKIKLPQGTSGVKPSKVIVTSVLSFDDLLLLLFEAGPMTHGTVVFVTLRKNKNKQKKGVSEKKITVLTSH